MQIRAMTTGIMPANLHPYTRGTSATCRVSSSGPPRKAAEMLYNYLVTAIRNLLKDRYFSLLNITGLAIGLACCILVYLYVSHETSFDRFHDRSDDIYGIARETRQADGSSAYNAHVSGPVAPALVADFPQIEAATRTTNWGVWVRHGERGFDENIYLVDPNFLDFFDFPLVRGDRHTALAEPFSMVITEKMAQQFFGSEDPIGKIMSISKSDAAGDYTVTGVVHRPANTTFRMYFDFLTSQLTPITRDLWSREGLHPVQTFVRLPRGQSPDSLLSQLPGFLGRHKSAEVAARTTYHLQPLTRMHLYEGVDFGGSGGRIAHVTRISLLGVLILAIACINFANLGTARSLRRAQEIGMRKAVGAHRRQLIGQFLGESVLTAIAALVLAVPLTQLLLPIFGQFVDRPLTLASVDPVSLAAALSLIALAGGLVAGVYPALVVSRFSPEDALRHAAGGRIGTSWLRRGLVIAQFAASTCLVLCTAIIYAQLSYIDRKDLGFDEDQVIIVPVFRESLESTEDPTKRLSMQVESVKSAFLEHPDIQSASASLYVAGHLRARPDPVRAHEPEATWKIRTQEVDEDFLQTLGIDLISGSNFSGTTADRTNLSLLINEAAARLIGWDDPVGQRLDWPGSDRSGTIVGVVADVHLETLHNAIAPLILANDRTVFWDLSLRVRSHDLPGVIAFLEEMWKRYCSIRTFRYHFLDQWLDDHYRSERVYARTLASGAAIGVFVACLGVLGLAALSVEQRMREIGVRRVLGATAAQILAVLSRETAILVTVASALAWPLAWYLMGSWLQGYAYRIDLGIGLFLVVTVSMLLLSLATVACQGLRGTSLNPVEALRAE